jgi:hypothetical protein
MQEKSPFTFRDLFKQRKRWMQGIYMVCTSPLIPIQSKLILSISLGVLAVTSIGIYRQLTSTLAGRVSAESGSASVKCGSGSRLYV